MILQEQVTAFQWLTVGIALVGLVLSVSALVWQFFTWRMTGSMVRVELAHGFTVGGTLGTIPVYTITARNVGRTQVSVTSWGLSLPKGDSTIIIPQPLPWQGPRVPVTLEPGHSETWYMIQQEVADSLRGNVPSGTGVRAMVRLGTGKLVKSKKSVRLEWA